MIASMPTAPLIVLGYGPLAGQPDISPFVSKLEFYLRLANVEYSKQAGNPRQSPRGKLPCLVHDGRTIADSARIIEYLRDVGIADLDGWLDDEQRAELVAMQSMIELELYFLVAYFRWQDPLGWAGYRDVIAEVVRQAGAPGPIARLVTRLLRRKTLAQLHGQGVGRREPGEVLARAHEIIGALQHFVARREGPWWFGVRPSSADAIAYAFLAAMISMQSGVASERLLDDRPRLRVWFDHVGGQLAS